MTALPWPAWHTDDSVACRNRVWAMDDVALAAAIAAHAAFLGAHYAAGWRLSEAQALEAYQVDDSLRYRGASRFLAILEQRKEAAQAAAGALRWQKARRA